MESILFNTFNGSFFEEENEAQVLVRKKKFLKSEFIILIYLKKMNLLIDSGFQRR